ncbi:MAG: hypothetical protein ACRDKG_07820 [Actinomycetota bacterium]
MRWVRWLPAILLFAAACGDPVVTPPLASSPDGQRLYETAATVLEGQGHGPELCLGAVADSYPPQCGGVPLEGWDWNAVDGEASAGGTTWGYFHVVGTFDGKAFTITRAPEPPAASTAEPDPITSPCKEPAGGWERPDPSKITESDLQATTLAAEAQKDFAGLWIFDPKPPKGDQAQDLSGIVLNVAFTGDIQRHTIEVRQHWGGALCVPKQTHTVAELQKIQDEAFDVGRGLGLTVLSAGASGNLDVVEIRVVFSDDSDQAEFDRLYGAGTVELTSAIKPL